VPRKLRIQFPGALYHVTSRGDRRQDIFLDDVDRQDFLKTLAEAWQQAADAAGASRAPLRSLPLQAKAGPPIQPFESQPFESR